MFGGRILFISAAILAAAPLPALAGADRIDLLIDNNRRAALPGQVSPRIQSALDRGPVDPSFELLYVTLGLKPSASQQRDLDNFLARLQDPSSPDYHNWLTPEQYADRFGVTQRDIDELVAWLESFGLTVKSVARARNAISFGGTAGRVSAAFGTQIHHYQVGGQTHYAGASSPTIPEAFQDVVLAIYGLDDFRPAPALSPAAKPRDTAVTGNLLAPDDLATIYDITPLYNAGLTGSGQKLAVVGQTQVALSDIEQYRSYFNLPPADPAAILVPGSQDPGLVEGTLLHEADLDLEIAGAIAPNAAILYIYASNVFDAMHYAIDQNLAPVISVSYYECELQAQSAGAMLFESWAKQAGTQGQTIFAPSGDFGAAGCYDGSDSSTSTSLSVVLPASLPEVTSVGGTELNEAGGSYWNLNNTANHASALSYIPETAWNDSAVKGFPNATGGGASVFFSKPSWQAGPGVPADGARDVPDVSTPASPNHDGYFFVTGGLTTLFGGGTSAGTPLFSAIAVLLGEYLVANGYQSSPSLGNINPGLYNLAPNFGMFHDIASGNNIVTPCTQPCGASAIGYDAGPGYDLVTGLGSPDVYNLISAWHASSSVHKQSATVTLAASTASVTFADSSTINLTAAVTGAGGTMPTGAVAFSAGNFLLGTASLDSGGVASLTIDGPQLKAGANHITAQYEGDATYYSAAASTSVSVTSPAGGPPSIAGITNAASYTQAVAPGGLMSVFGSQLTPPGVSYLVQTVPWPVMLAGTSANINGIPTPLDYAGSGQLNIQIPYSVPAGSGATLELTNNGQTAFYNFPVAAAAPAIFTTNAQGTGQGAILDLSYKLVDASNPATPGKTYLQIYCTGLGAVTHQPADGAPAPVSPLARTVATPQVTVGGIQAQVIFSGLAPNYVGLYQVDALVPASTPAGNAVQVIMSVGAASSNTVTIAVGQ